MFLDKALVCGVDEAGRGPLAGPVFAAAVILNPERRIGGLADSKMLNSTQRNALAVEIRREAIAWATASASVEEIDRLNILQATLLAMKRAVNQLTVAPTHALIDGLHAPALTISCQTVVRGDCTEAAISAASILAKTTRDAVLVQLHHEDPRYGFNQHKGYPTAAHRAALEQYGVSPFHRRSFAPVQRVLRCLGEAIPWVLPDPESV